MLFILVRGDTNQWMGLVVYFGSWRHKPMDVFSLVISIGSWEHEP